MFSPVIFSTVTQRSPSPLAASGRLFTPGKCFQGLKNMGNLASNQQHPLESLDPLVKWSCKVWALNFPAWIRFWPFFKDTAFWTWFSDPQWSSGILHRFFEFWIICSVVVFVNRWGRQRWEDPWFITGDERGRGRTGQQKIRTLCVCVWRESQPVTSRYQTAPIPLFSIDYCILKGQRLFIAFHSSLAFHFSSTSHKTNSAKLLIHWILLNLIFVGYCT